MLRLPRGNMKIAISAENTIDLPKELLDKFDIHVISFDVTLGDETSSSFTSADVFDYVDKTGVLPKTSALNEIEYGEFFDELLKDYDAVIHFTIGSKISSTYNNAVRAAKERKNCYVVDTQALSTGSALIAIYASRLAKKGFSPEDIVNKANARTSCIQTSFVVERLDYLYKGGRCSALALFGANLLKIRPQIQIKDGAMQPTRKYRGRMEDVVKKYCEDTLAEFNNPDKSIGFVTYSSANDEMIKIGVDALKNAGFKTIYTTLAGPTVGSHCGRNTLGIFYINDGEQKD